MALFAMGALRALVEMLGLCLIGQGVLYVLAGRRRENNAIYCLFRFLTRPPVGVVAFCLPRNVPATVPGIVTFVLLFGLWIGLAILRKFV